ncbi:MAG: acetylxylan esterase [Kiritimatiellaeota bacterium]|nr:acetylxylan esterase [Kiritimatiellota bacterium]
MNNSHSVLRLGAAFLPACFVSFGAAPRVMPAGARPDDQRLKKLRTLNDYFPCRRIRSPEEWAVRAAELRRQVLLAVGLWPMPPRTPLNAVVHGRREFDDYTVEKVFFESIPGFFVTGTLYRPKAPAPQGGRPGVLCPHGHWPGGRFYDAAEAAGPRNIRRQIADGAERFVEGGRSPIQARCVQLARMGCTAFVYDMIGYADSIQLPHAPGMRDAMNTRSDWGFFSPAAELRLQTMMGLQTWDSIRALDFLCSLPDVDRDRIAVTGASGGGTQTFILGAIDDRPALLFPAVMVSTAMQGGCTCENASYLRIGAGNVDIAALAAHPDAFREEKPRPLGMTAADDWTRQMPEKGFPELKHLYELLGAPDRVALFSFPQFGHNYNSVSRGRMYSFLNRFFHLGFEDPVLERDYTFLSGSELSVWDESTRPAGDRKGEALERRLLREWTKRWEEQFRGLVPRDRAGLEAFRRVIGGAWQTILGRSLDSAGDVQMRQVGRTMAGPFAVDLWLLDNTTWHEQVPALVLEPPSWAGDLVLWVTDDGKSGLFEPGGSPRPEVRTLLESGVAVAGIDMLDQGEFPGSKHPPTRQRLVPGGKAPYVGYTFGYNPPLFCRRVHDVLTALAAAQRAADAPRRICLMGTGRVAGAVVAAARLVTGEAVPFAAVDGRGFRFDDLDRVDDPMFVPGAVKYGDVGGLLALSAPWPLSVIVGESLPREAATLVRTVYSAAGAAEALRCPGLSPEQTGAAALVDALLEQLRE